MYVLYYYEKVMCLTTLVFIYMYVSHVTTLQCILHEVIISKFINYLNLEQAYEGNKMMQSPYLVDRDVLYIYRI